MQVDVKGILAGIGNSIFIKEEIQKISNYRLNICSGCPHYSPNIKKKGWKVIFPYRYCEDCGCNMYLKTKYLSAKCPLGGPKSNFPDEESKWPAYLDDEKLSEKLLETEEMHKELVDYKIKLSRKQINEHGD